MPLKDSIDKIIGYFNMISTNDFYYKNKQYKSKILKISPNLLRDFTCPTNCGACCSVFSLDYLPHENKPKETKSRYIIFNNNKIKIYSDLQLDNKTPHCKYLNLENGRCNIYKVRPFSCDFELIKRINNKNYNGLQQKLYGRGWNMLRIDEKRGALCKMLPPSEESKHEVIRKLKRLKNWEDHFKLQNTLLIQIIELLETDLQLNFFKKQIILNVPVKNFKMI